MDFDEIAESIAGVPHIVPERGRELYDFVLAERPREVIELGFAHGASTCYIAAALDELGKGHITTLDTVRARNRKPSLSELLSRTGLREWVRPVYANRTYTWELRKLLRDGSSFEFAFIDGAHTWEVDGFAFLLVDRMLEARSWVLFDDLDWTISVSPTLRDSPETSAMPEDERTTAQVREVYELLVRRHPEYHEFREDGEWAWARKRAESADERVALCESLERRLTEMESSTTWKVGRAVTAIPRNMKRHLLLSRSPQGGGS